MSKATDAHSLTEDTIASKEGTLGSSIDNSHAQHSLPSTEVGRALLQPMRSARAKTSIAISSINRAEELNRSTAISTEAPTLQDRIHNDIQSGIQKGGIPKNITECPDIADAHTITGIRTDDGIIKL